MRVDYALLDRLFDEWMLTDEGKKLHAQKATSDLGMTVMVFLLGVILICTIYYAVSGFKCIVGIFTGEAFETTISGAYRSNPNRFVR
ncbi:MAG: hypothetical protein AAFX06_12250 [Planctomycetota bacterium]